MVGGRTGVGGSAMVGRGVLVGGCVVIGVVVVVEFGLVATASRFLMARGIAILLASGFIFLWGLEQRDVSGRTWVRVVRPKAPGVKRRWGGAGGEVAAGRTKDNAAPRMSATIQPWLVC